MILMKNVPILCGLLIQFSTYECTIFNWTNPVIPSSSGSGVIQENITEGSSGYLGIQVQATTDKPSFPFPTYSIESNPNGLVFSIDQDHGYLSLLSGTLDYETSIEVILIVIVDDAETIGTATCTIRLTDINDNAPRFSTKYALLVIEDNLSSGTSIIRMNAYDSDGTSPNNNISYAITNGNTNGDFSIRTDGTISVTYGKNLDRNRTQMYDLLVMAFDGGTDPSSLSSSTVILLCIETCQQTESAANIFSSQRLAASEITGIIIGALGLIGLVITSIVVLIVIKKRRKQRARNTGNQHSKHNYDVEVRWKQRARNTENQHWNPYEDVEDIREGGIRMEIRDIYMGGESPYSIYGKSSDIFHSEDAREMNIYQDSF